MSCTLCRNKGREGERERGREGERERGRERNRCVSMQPSHLPSLRTCQLQKLSCSRPRFVLGNECRGIKCSMPRKRGATRERTLLTTRPLDRLSARRRRGHVSGSSSCPRCSADHACDRHVSVLVSEFRFTVADTCLGAL